MPPGYSRLGELGHHYDPNQPRVPKGEPDGGQWTRVAANEPTERPPNRPTRRTIAERGRGGGAWLGEFFKGLQDLIETYAGAHAAPDLFGYKKGLENDTISAGRVDGRPFIGVNSNYVTYTTADRLAAERLRDDMVHKYDDVSGGINIGRKPNDAFFHAETTLLLRAAREFGGSLQGKVVFIYSSRAMCPGCGTLLPLIGTELGNPTVVFSDYESGRIVIMRDGRWIFDWSAK